MAHRPIRVDWLRPLALFAPADDNIMAPVPLPAWILREFGSRLDLKGALPPITGLVVAPDRLGRVRGVRWAADPKWGPPSLAALETLLWIQHAAILRRLPEGVLVDPSIRMIASWRESLTVGGVQSQEIRSHLLMLGAVRAWRLASVRPGEDVARADLEAWDERVGRTGVPLQVRSSGLLDVEVAAVPDGPRRVKTNITGMAIHPDVLHPESSEPLIWIDPHWHAELPPLGVRFLHRLLDPLPPQGWADGGVSQSYPEMVNALGIPPELAGRIGRAHGRIDHAGQALEKAGWIGQWHATRAPRGDARGAIYHWAAADRLITHRSLAALDLAPLSYRDRVIPAVLINLGISPKHVAEWIGTYSPKLLRDHLQYMIFRNSATSVKIRAPYAYLKAALAKGTPLADSTGFRMFVREHTMPFLPGATDTIVVAPSHHDRGKDLLVLPRTARLLEQPSTRLALSAGAGEDRSESAPETPGDELSSDGADLTRRMMGYLATHAAPDISGPWLEAPITWRALARPGGGMRLELPAELLQRIQETGTLDKILRSAAMELTKLPTYSLMQVSGDGTVHCAAEGISEAHDTGEGS